MRSAGSSKPSLPRSTSCRAATECQQLDHRRDAKDGIDGHFVDASMRARRMRPDRSRTGLLPPGDNAGHLRRLDTFLQGRVDSLLRDIDAGAAEKIPLQRARGCKCCRSQQCIAPAERRGQHVAQGFSGYAQPKLMIVTSRSQQATDAARPGIGRTGSPPGKLCCPVARGECRARQAADVRPQGMCVAEGFARCRPISSGNVVVRKQALAAKVRRRSKALQAYAGKPSASPSAPGRDGPRCSGNPFPKAQPNWTCDLPRRCAAPDPWTTSGDSRTKRCASATQIYVAYGAAWAVEMRIAAAAKGTAQHQHRRKTRGAGRRRLGASG